jgi:hypothetical protein
MITEYNYVYDFDTTGWDLIKTFNDALKLNIEFLQGLRKSTPYHGAPVYDVNASKLVFIHKFGKIFTQDGQSNKCEYEALRPETKIVRVYIDKLGNKSILKEFVLHKAKYSQEQKSYLEGYLEMKNVPFFMSFLKKYEGKIGLNLYDVKNDNYLTNFESTWVTRAKIEGNEKWDPYSNAHREPNLMVYEEWFGHIKENLCYFFIHSLKPCDINVEDVLYEYATALRKKSQKGKSRRNRKTKKSKKKSVRK